LLSFPGSGGCAVREGAVGGTISPTGTGPIDIEKRVSILLKKPVDFCRTISPRACLVRNFDGKHPERELKKACG